MRGFETLMHSDIGDALDSVTVTIGAFIALVVEFYASHTIISAFESVVSDVTAKLLFALIGIGSFVVFILGLADLLGVRGRG